MKKLIRTSDTYKCRHMYRYFYQLTISEWMGSFKLFLELYRQTDYMIKITQIKLHIIHYIFLGIQSLFHPLHPSREVSSSKSMWISWIIEYTAGIQVEIISYWYRYGSRSDWLPVWGAYIMRSQNPPTRQPHPHPPYIKRTMFDFLHISTQLTGST